MSFLTDSNYETGAFASFLHKKKLTPYIKQKRKFLYLEGLIRFLELYANNEIGNVEVDIEKVSLWINSPQFENIDLYKVTSIEAVFKMLENDLYNNIPLFRFLKFSEYQQRIFETEHRKRLLEDFYNDCEKYPCLKCIWYHRENTSIGQLSKCRCPKDDITNRPGLRTSGYHKIENHKKCKYVTTVENAEHFYEMYVSNIIGTFRKESFRDNVNRYVKEFKEKIENMDNSYIPPYIPEDDHVGLDFEFDDITERLCNGLGRAFRNKQDIDGIKQNRLKAMMLEAVIKFVELYAQIELGSDYQANISEIAKYVEKNKFTFKSYDEVYQYLENLMFDGFDMTKFCKRKET